MIVTTTDTTTAPVVGTAGCDGWFWGSSLLLRLSSSCCSPASLRAAAERWGISHGEEPAGQFPQTHLLTMRLRITTTRSPTTPTTTTRTTQHHHQRTSLEERTRAITVSRTELSCSSRSRHTEDTAVASRRLSLPKDLPRVGKGVRYWRHKEGSCFFQRTVS